MCENVVNLGDRVALKGSEYALGNTQRGIVEYYGEVAGASNGLWVGVDWDDANRGKHDGSFKGIQYFKARTSNSGSFVRPNVLITGTELISEIEAKYADNSFPSTTSSTSTDDRWEFVQLEKIYEKQKNIFDLKCIVLTNVPVSHINRQEIKKFEKCVELDLSGTFLRKWSQLFKIISYFPNLKTLHLSNTRMEELSSEIDLSLFNIPLLSEISLNGTLISAETANAVTDIFTSIKEIYLAFNNLSFYAPTKNFEKLCQVDLQGNNICNFSQISILQSLHNLTFLNLSACGLERIEFGEIVGFAKLNTLFIQDNPISDWGAIDELARLPSLRKLLIKGTKLCGINGLHERELIIAKIPNLIEVDHCDISEVSRRSIELYVLSCLSKTPVNPVHLHTLEKLEKIYGPRNLRRNEDMAQKGLNVNLRRLNLEFNGQKVQRNLSLLLSIHRIVGMASKLFDFDPDDIFAVELRRANLSPERLKRTKDNLLNQFDLEDDDSIAFLLA